MLDQKEVMNSFQNVQQFDDYADMIQQDLARERVALQRNLSRLSTSTPQRGRHPQRGRNVLTLAEFMSQPIQDSFWEDNTHLHNFNGQVPHGHTVGHSHEVHNSGRYPCFDGRPFQGNRLDQLQERPPVFSVPPVQRQHPTLPSLFGIKIFLREIYILPPLTHPPITM